MSVGLVAMLPLITFELEMLRYVLHNIYFYFSYWYFVVDGIYRVIQFFLRFNSACNES